ncbi:MAG: SDR family oxidoreductase [Oscillospiraceae bacterium]|nr:SDR family oxidoreductase [Oscillospiraceae bacterium]
MKRFDLTGKAIIVTGAAGGFGTELVKILAEHGADVAALDMREPAYCADIEAQYGVRCIPAVCNICSMDEVTAAVDKVLAAFGKIDGLVNNAGLYGGLTMGPFQDLDPDEWDKVFSVNVKGTWQMTKGVVPQMIAQQSGSIVNISSCSILQGVPGLCHYVASKGAVWAMTRTMANELGAYNIRVNSVTPGYALTDASKQLVGSPEDLKQNSERNINDRAIRRGMMADDVVGAIAFLVTDASSFISGQNINVDGGSIHY